ncbi:MAG: 2-hydroxyacyl-CoA dehydratase [Candidatus Brocadiales bacterium]
MLTVGIDIGSLSTNGILLNDKKEILASDIIATGASSKKAAEKSFQNLLKPAGLSEKDIALIVATGYGRIRVPFASEVVTEITCHARGANYFFPKVRTIIDIGGQDSKAIKVDSNGTVLDFVMNDKCAAGTGRFLEVMARTLEIDLDDMGPLSLKGNAGLTISSLCTVFAESEVVSLIGADKKAPDICRALHMSIAKRITGQVKRVGLEEELAMTGGVAKNIGVVRELERSLGTAIKIASEPQIIGALGAALIALDNAKKSSDVVSVVEEVRPQVQLEENVVSIANVSLEDSSLPKIGYMCSYTPVEIIRAAGFHPIRVKGSNTEDSSADEHMCANLCPYIKTVLEKKLSGGLEHLQGMVFANSCDGMRRLYDTWVRLDGDKKFNYILDVPKNDDEAAIHYFADLLKTLKERLEKYFGLIVHHEDIIRSISLYNRVREKVKPFLLWHGGGYSGHSGYEILTLLRKGINAVPEKFHDYLTYLMSRKNLNANISDLSAQPHNTTKEPRLLLWGGIVEDEGVIKLIEDAGARVVADDLCSGSRYFDTVVDITDNPYVSIAKRYLQRIPCSRMENVSDRIKNAISLVEQYSIQGAVYHTLKFCDHSLYDFPLIKKEFQKKNIPLLHLNCDYSPSTQGQIKTRVEAFLEQLASSKNVN